MCRHLSKREKRIADVWRAAAGNHASGEIASEALFIGENMRAAITKLPAAWPASVGVGDGSKNKFFVAGIEAIAQKL